MAKGVKKIILAEGLGYKNLSIPGKIYVIAPDKWVWFEVAEWEAGTTADDKKKNITWLRQDQSRKTIIKQMTIPATDKYGFKLPKKLCGNYLYYIEASLSGKRDFKSSTGLYVKGKCDSKIISSKWTTQPGGTTSIKNKNKTNYISYGHIVYLQLSTEGLNGNQLTIELYNQQYAKDDKLIKTYKGVTVVNGEVNVKIPDTFSWMAYVDNIQKVEEFYVKVKNANGNYIKDNLGDDLHAIYLNVKNKVVTTNVQRPENITPTKIYKPDVNAARYEPCKFDSIKISETEIKDGKATTTSVVIFDQGKKLSNVTHPAEPIIRTIHFDFDSANIDTDGVKTLNNVLKFLLEHEHSIINLNGYACVIGKMQYNKGLSQKRGDVVKKFFTDGGLDGKRITSTGKGEINATDSKTEGDDIKYKDEKIYIEARRVDISFSFNGHDAKTIIYETIAPSITTKKDMVIDITGFKNKDCFRDKDKHEKKVTVLDVGQAIDTGDTKISFPPTSFTYKVYSDLSRFNLMPLQYIWPAATTPNKIYFGVHTCRYYSNKKNATFLIKVFPDIKWELAFELKIDVEHYSHTNMPQGSIFAKHQKKAREAGYARWLMNKQGKVPIKIGAGLKAEWDNGKQKLDLTKDFEKKIETTAKLLSKTVELVQNAINICRGVMKDTSIPVSFGVEYPKFEAVGSWYLQREGQYLQLAIVGEVSFAAKPLIGANVTIDLIAAAVAVGSYATTGSPAIAKIVQKIRDAGKYVGAEIAADAKFYGQLEVVFDALKINSLKGIEGGSLTIGGKMGIMITIKVSAGNELKINKLEVKFKFAAEAKAHAYFGGDFKLDSDKIGLFIEPTLKFSGVKISLEMKMEVGWFTRSFTVEGDILPEDKISLGKKYITN